LVAGVLVLHLHQAQVEQLAHQEEIQYLAQSLPLGVGVVRLIVHLLGLMEQVVVLAAAGEALVVGLLKQAGREILHQLLRHKEITAGMVGLETAPI